MRAAKHFAGQAANALALDVGRLERVIHQHGGEGADLDGGIPAVHVEAGVGLGDAHVLGLLDGLIEAAAVLHFGQHQIGGGIEDAAQAGELGGGQRLAEEREDRRAAHDGGFVQEAHARLAARSRSSW